MAPGWPRDGPRQHLVAEPSRAERCVSTGTCPGHVQDMSRACGGWCLSPALRRAPLSLRGDGSLAAVYGDDSLVAALGVELRLSQPFNTQCHDCLKQRPSALSCAARGEASSSSELSRLYLGYISPRGAKRARAASYLGCISAISRREGRSAAPKLEQRAAARQRRRQQRPHLSTTRNDNDAILATAPAASGRTSSYSASQSAGASCPGAAYACSERVVDVSFL